VEISDGKLNAAIGMVLSKDPQEVTGSIC